MPRPDVEAARTEPPRARSAATPWWKTPATSSERLDKAVDAPVEFRVALAQGVDLANRVDHGGVVLAPEGLADLGQGGPSERLDEVHRDLARLGHGLGVVLGLELGDLHPELVGHELLDHLD